MIEPAEKIMILEKSGAVDRLAQEIVGPHTEFMMAALARPPVTKKDWRDFQNLYRYGMVAGICAGVRHGHTDQTADSLWPDFLEQGVKDWLGGGAVSLDNLWHCNKAFLHGFGHGRELYQNTQVSRVKDENCGRCMASDCRDCLEKEENTNEPG